MPTQLQAQYTQLTGKQKPYNKYCCVYGNNNTIYPLHNIGWVHCVWLRVPLLIWHIPHPVALSMALSSGTLLYSLG